MPKSSTNEKKSAPRFGATLLYQFARLEDRIDEKEKLFLGGLLEEWNKRTYDIQEVALWHGAAACGVGWFGGPDNHDFLKKHGVDLEQFQRILQAGPEWLQSFLVGLAIAQARGSLRTPEDVLFHLRQDLVQFEMQREAAQAFLKSNPELLADEIRTASAKLAGGAK